METREVGDEVCDRFIPDIDVREHEKGRTRNSLGACNFFCVYKYDVTYYVFV